MKIAFATDDGKTIVHILVEPAIMVITVENGQPTQHELRDKLGHNHFANEPHQSHDESQPHGFDSASQNRHVKMTEVIRDCEAMVCKGMGRGAYESMRTMNIHPLVTDIDDVDEAAIAYANG